jgi:hypothetical protein
VLLPSTAQRITPMLGVLLGMQCATSRTAMIFIVLAQLLSFLLDLVATARLSDREKDLKLLLLRQQLRTLQRKQAHPPPENPGRDTDPGGPGGEI